MDLPKIEFVPVGMNMLHNLPCPIYYDKHAVFDVNHQCFTPCWFARNEGWMFVRATGWKQRIIKWLAEEARPS